MNEGEWNEYTNDRLILKHPSGFYVIKPKDFERGQPLFCPVCEIIMKTIYDDESYQKFECCDRCASTWAYPHKEKWKAGWRPSMDEISNKFGEHNIYSEESAKCPGT